MKDTQNSVLETDVIEKLLAMILDYKTNDAIFISLGVNYKTIANILKPIKKYNFLNKFEPYIEFKKVYHIGYRRKQFYKIREPQILEIYKTIIKSDVISEELANRFGVSDGTISRVLRANHNYANYRTHPLFIEMINTKVRRIEDQIKDIYSEIKKKKNGDKDARYVSDLEVIIRRAKVSIKKFKDLLLPREDVENYVSPKSSENVLKNILKDALDLKTDAYICKKYNISIETSGAIIHARTTYKYLKDVDYYKVFILEYQKNVRRSVQKNSLTTKQVINVFIELSKGIPKTEVAKKFKVSDATISSVAYATKGYRGYKTHPEFIKYVNKSIVMINDALINTDLLSSRKKSLIQKKKLYESLIQKEGSEKMKRELGTLGTPATVPEGVLPTVVVTEQTATVINPFNVTMLIGAAKVKRFIGWRINDMLSIIYDLNIEKYIMLTNGVESPITKPTAEVLVQSALETLEYINFEKDKIVYSYVKNIHNNNWESNND